MIPGSMRPFVQQVGVRQRENAREALVATAHAEERRVISQQRARSGGIAPTLTRIVDGRRGAAYETVRESGLIILKWGYMREIATVALARLRARAPERSGEYKAGIKLFVGDAEAGLSAGGIPANATIFTVVATAPYSRRLEFGRDSAGGPFVVQVAPHIVEETARFLARDYQGVARVRFVYEDVQGPGVGAARSAAVRGTDRGERRAARRAAATLRYPAIRVTDDR